MTQIATSEPTATPNIQIRQLKHLSDQRAVKGFIDVYRSAFGGAPYFEKMTKKHVLEHVIKPHLKHGMLLIAEVDGEIAALAGGYPMLADVHTEIRDYLLAQPKEHVPFNPHFAFFESELAALTHVRRFGLGNRLLCMMHRWAWENRFTHYVGRTITGDTPEEQSKAIGLHLRNGAVQLPFVQVAGVEEQQVESKAKRKVWFYGETEKFANYDHNAPLPAKK